jgi:carboxylate-amine ligase
MPLPFKGSDSMTLGVEMELQIISKETKDLVAGAPKIFEKLGGEQPHIKPELMQAMIEINTGVCDSVKRVRADLDEQVGTLRGACEGLGFMLASSGSHPFARYSDRIPYPAERYAYLIDRNRWMARRLMIFGLHVHVGMRDAEHVWQMNNAMLQYLPHVLALSASSPFWQSKDTGLASSRVTIFEALPTGGHPCTFENWQEFESFYDSMIASKSIASMKDIWWDIRPNPDYGTLELRVCDGLPTINETVGLVAFVQCLYRWLDEQYRNGTKFTPTPYWILRENKWKASRYGVEASIILDEAGRTNLLRDEINTLLTTLAPFATSCGCEEELAVVRVMLEKGLSYERQKKVYEREGTFLAVTEMLIKEFEDDTPVYGPRKE